MGRDVIAAIDAGHIFIRRGKSAPSKCIFLVVHFHLHQFFCGILQFWGITDKYSSNPSFEHKQILIQSVFPDLKVGQQRLDGMINI